MNDDVQVDGVGVMVDVQRAIEDSATVDGHYAAAPQITVTRPADDEARVQYQMIKNGVAGPLVTLTEPSVILPAFTEDGTYELRVYTERRDYAEDADGNVSVSANDNCFRFSFCLDTSGPTLTTDTGYEPRKPGASMTVNASPLFEDASTPLRYTFTPYTLNPATMEWKQGTEQSGANATYTVSAAFRGKILATATDVLGNVGQTYTVSCIWGQSDAYALEPGPGGDSHDPNMPTFAPGEEMGCDGGSHCPSHGFAAILYRYAKYKGYDVRVGDNTNMLSYTDADQISAYAIPAMQWAVGAGILTGFGSSLLPKQGATRAQAAAMLMRFVRKMGE